MKNYMHGDGFPLMKGQVRIVWKPKKEMWLFYSCFFLTEHFRDFRVSVNSSATQVTDIFP